MEEGLDQKFNKTQLRMNIFHIVWPVFIEVLLGSLFGMVDMMDGRSYFRTCSSSSICCWNDEPTRFLRIEFCTSIKMLGDSHRLLVIMERRNIKILV